jgi:hypothetical protein
MDQSEIEAAIPDSIIEKIAKLANYGYDELKKCVLLNRTITTLFSVVSFPDLKQTIDPLIICHFSSITPLDALKYYSPMQVQGISYLIRSLYDDPTAFAIAISAYRNSPHFSYIASILVPAVFNYFSTRESLEQATIFYIACGSHMSFEQYRLFLRAYFGNSWTSVFTEIALSRVLSQFYFRTPSVDAIVRKIIESVNQNINYLPQQMIFVIDYIANHFGKQQAYEFIAKELICPHISIVMKVTPFGHCDKPPVHSEDLLHAIEKCEIRHMNLFNFDKIRTSKFEPPGALSVPDHNINFHFVFSPFDIFLLTQLKMEFPAMMKPILIPNLLRRQDAAFYVEILVSGSKKSAKGVLTENIELVKTRYLEAYLATFIDIERIVAWNDSTLRYLDDLSFCAIFVKKQPIGIQLVEQTWVNAFKVPNIGTVRFWNAISALDQCEKATIKPFEKKLYLIEEQWSCDILILKMEYKENPILSTPIIRNAFTEVSSMMQLVSTNSSFSDRFIVLVAFLRGFFTLINVHPDFQKKPSSLLSTCFVVFDAPWIIRTHVFIMSGAMRDQLFCTACPNDIYDMFMKFTPCLLTTLSRNDNTADKLTDLISTIIPLRDTNPK